MSEYFKDEKNRSILYPLPLTAVAGKIRIKERFTFSDYGLPIAPTQTIINGKHYIEWQIGYDKVSLKDESKDFIAANGKSKRLYELSEIIKEFYLWKEISRQNLLDIKFFLENNKELIEDRLDIQRTHFKEYQLANLPFLKALVSYPLLIYKFENKDFISEIIIKEKQRAMGIQAMLYFCFPLSCLENSKQERDFLHRQIKSKEQGFLRIDSSNIAIFLNLFKIFGILSKNHKHDILQIITFLLGLK